MSDSEPGRLKTYLYIMRPFFIYTVGSVGTALAFLAVSFVFSLAEIHMDRSPLVWAPFLVFSGHGIFFSTKLFICVKKYCRHSGQPIESLSRYPYREFIIVMEEFTKKQVKKK